MSTQQTCPRCGSGALSGEKFVCDNCTKIGALTFRAAGDFLANIDDKRAKRGTNFPKGGGGKSAEAPLPYDPRVRDVALKARTMLTTWARLIIDQHQCRDLPSRQDTARIARLEQELAAWHKVSTTAGLSAVDEMCIRQFRVSLNEDIDEARTKANLSELSHICEWVADHMEWISTRAWSADIVNDAEDLNDALVHLFDIPPETMALGRCDAEQGDGTVCQHILAAPLKAVTYECPRCTAVHNCEQRRRDLIRRSDDLVVTAKEGARLLRMGGYNVDSAKMYAVIRVVGIRSRLKTKSITTGRAVEHYTLGSLREGVQICEREPEKRKAVDATRHGARGRGEQTGATLSA